MEILTTMPRKFMTAISSSIFPNDSTFRRENFSHKIFDGLIVKIGGKVKVQARFRKLHKINFIILIFRYQCEKLRRKFIRFSQNYQKVST
jgi:hypothetical protein